MKTFISTFTGLVLLVTALSGQNYLTPSEGNKAFNLFPGFTSFGAFDLDNHLLYANDGDTIHCLNLETGLEENKLGKPEGYEGAYASFVTIAPDGQTIWTGFTVFGNSDDRIYSVDVETGIWNHQATLPGNFDLEFWNDSILVSGLNSMDWTAPCSIYLLDTSGLDQHRKIIEAGGYAAGFALDGDYNLYYGTSYSQETNSIYRWDSISIANLFDTSGFNSMSIADGEKLTDLSSGANDCEVDASDHLVFTINDFSSDKVLAKWNGIKGDGLNYDTLALAPEPGDWLGMVKSQGNFNTPAAGNRLITSSLGRPLAELHIDYLPVLTRPIPLFTGLESENNATIRLEDYFTDPDDDDAFTYEVVVNSDPAVAEVALEEGELVVNFHSAGQTNVVLEASNAGKKIIEKTVVGVQPIIEGENLLADFEDLVLEKGSYWNGSDGSGGFTTGEIYFHNEYNPDWFSWSGWAYSNVSDNTTPGFVNQYSAMPGNGFEKTQSAGDSYGVGFVFGSPVLDFVDNLAHQVAGVFVTNSTYAGLSIEHGDAFSKKFGGEEGTDPDYFKLMIWGHVQGSSTDTVEYFLADYRFENDAMDYLIKTWQWVDLSSLGEVDSLMFGLQSSDMGDWGMNTPGFFCVNNMYLVPNATSVGTHHASADPGYDLTVYPNPNPGRFLISTKSEDAMGVKVFSLTGSLLFERPHHSPGEEIDISAHPAGSYLIRVTTKQDTFTRIIQKQ